MAAVLGLLEPLTVQAGPYLGDWGWLWHQGPECPKGEYCPLHYWTPGVYRVRALVHPANLDQYSPGPDAQITPCAGVIKYRCRATSPAPASPYADPAAYFGRPMTPADMLRMP